MSSSPFSLTANYDDTTPSLDSTLFSSSTPNPLDLSGLQVPIGLLQTSTFDPSNQLVDPTNTGDTGALNNTSTPLLPSINNPETAGNSSLGTVLSSGINDVFAAWQLSSQPKGTPKVVTTQVGSTKVVSGASPSILSSLFGGAAATPAAASSNTILLLIVLAIIGLLVYRAVK